VFVENLHASRKLETTYCLFVGTSWRIRLQDGLETTYCLFVGTSLRIRLQDGLETTYYATDRKQLTDFFWYRESGVRVNIGLQNINVAGPPPPPGIHKSRPLHADLETTTELTTGRVHPRVRSGRVTKTEKTSGSGRV